VLGEELRRNLGACEILVANGVASVGVRSGARSLRRRSTSSDHLHEREEHRVQSVIIESTRSDIDNDRLLIFIGNVVAWQRNWRLYADRIEVIWTRYLVTVS